MPANRTLRKRFTLIMLSVYLCSLPLMIFITYHVLISNAETESMERAELMLTSMKGLRGYIGGTMRPLAQDLLPGEAPVEFTSGFFILRSVSENISKETGKEYSFKFACINPLNPVNQSDEFETGIINEFRSGTAIKEWRGFTRTATGKSYAIMTPIKVDPPCLKCHGVPEDAPKDQLKQYGTARGYHWKAGEIIGANTVYVPAKVPFYNALKALAVFSVIYSIFFFAVIFVIDRLIRASVVKPIENFVATADEISRGKFDKDFVAHGDDEIRTLAEAFTRMKRSLEKAMEMINRR